MSEGREVQGWPRLSPDGKWLARQRVDGVEGNPDIWVEHLELGTPIRVTTSPHVDILAVWSPDGRQLAYISDARGKPAISIAAADGTGVQRTIPCPGLACETTDWSADGTELIVTVRTASGSDVWAVHADAEAAAHPILAEAFAELDARLSPLDSEWIAYVSNESGQDRVSVRSRTGDPRRTVISSAGGSQPVWRRDGSELFFVDTAGRLLSVSVRRTADGSLTFGVPVVMPVPPIGSGHWSTQYDVSPDGSRVYFMDRDNTRPSPAINVLLGWRQLLR
jgi:Tol biopolymer transport system component